MNTISIVFRSLREIHRNRGFTATVIGREVDVKVWIHFSMEIHPGNRKEIHHLYRGCKCEYDQLSNTNPQCVYITLEDMQLAKRIKLND